MCYWQMIVFGYLPVFYDDFARSIYVEKYEEKLLTLQKRG